MNIFSIIFSIRNDNYHKVITVFGIKFKIYSVKLHLKIHEKKLKALKPMIKYAKLAKYQINKDLEDFKIKQFKRNNIIGINLLEKRTPQLIVSLTSFPERIAEAKYTIYSLLNQTVKPDKIILWLAEGQFPYGDEDLTQDLLDFKNNGLTIEYVRQDWKSYKKLIPALLEYPNDIIVTADDDLYYPPQWLEMLYNEYLNDQSKMYAHRVFKATLGKGGRLNPACDWERIHDESCAMCNHPTTGGGVLFPPNSLYKDVTNENLFMNLAPNCDESWIWAMAVLNYTKTKVVKDHLQLIFVNAFKSARVGTETALGRLNNDEKQKDVQLANIIEHYPELIKILKEEKKGKIE